jgi:hypothetical protein
MTNMDIVHAINPICPSCRRPMAPPGLQLSPIQTAILRAVEKRGAISCTELIAVIWDSDPGGGPLSAAKGVHNHVFFLNKRLAPFGVRVAADHKGAGARYVICKAR